MEIPVDKFRIIIDPDKATRVINGSNHIVAIRDSNDGEWLMPPTEELNEFRPHIKVAEKLIVDFLGEVSHTSPKKG